MMKGANMPTLMIKPPCSYSVYVSAKPGPARPVFAGSFTEKSDAIVRAGALDRANVAVRIIENDGERLRLIRGYWEEVQDGAVFIEEQEADHADAH